jgi:hypothetical protein
MVVEDFQTLLNNALPRYQLAVARVKEEKRILAESEERYEVAARSQKLVQEVATAVQKQAHGKIASVVSKCLKAVYGEEAYSFKIAFEQKRGRTEAKLLFERDGNEFEADDVGGGILDVAAFALRLSCILLATPKRRRFLAMDEAFRHVDATHTTAVRKLLLSLSEEMKFQFLLVTHNNGLRAGKVIQLGVDQ